MKPKEIKSVEEILDIAAKNFWLESTTFTGRIRLNAVEDTLRKNGSYLVIQGTKSFSAIEVKNNVTTNTVKEKSEKEQNFTGSVRIVGTVQVVESFRSDWINGINVYVLPGVLVDKNAHQIGIKVVSIINCNHCSLITFVVKGFVHFTGPLPVDYAEVDSLNDLLIKDLLSTSGQQTILASIEVDVLDVQGNGNATVDPPAPAPTPTPTLAPDTSPRHQPPTPDPRHQTTPTTAPDTPDHPDNSPRHSPLFGMGAGVAQKATPAPKKMRRGLVSVKHMTPAPPREIRSS
ncbi:hypothetical protein OUZ56_029306 [Daphnia magna]|uniref:Uncharacterized protein n=1 Tax=Daphnia magna TaxID=35525 RepID=A0ABR0B6F3_9CRUS|nr:hypothetical protein OUZ56_029306 [Daphnia magna]